MKIGEFEAEYAGKMQLYLTALDEMVKLPDENPSIVATYQLRNTLPEEMKAMLPEPEEIVQRLKIFEEI